MLLARLVDLLSFWVWGHTEDGQKGFNRPPSILESFMDNSDTKPMSFATGAEFDAYYEELARKARGGE